MVERGQLLLEIHELFSFLCSKFSLAILLVCILWQGLPVRLEHLHCHVSRDTLTTFLIVILNCFIIGKDLWNVDGLHIFIRWLHKRFFLGVPFDKWARVEIETFFAVDYGCCFWISLLNWVDTIRGMALNNLTGFDDASERFLRLYIELFVINWVDIGALRVTQDILSLLWWALI